MFAGYQNTEELIRNLRDAECSEELVADLLSCLFKGNKAGCLCLLEKRRAEILRGIHKEQSDIEYLDGLLGGLRENNR